MLGVGENARKGVTYYVNPYTAEILPEVSGQIFSKRLKVFIEDYF